MAHPDSSIIPDSVQSEYLFYHGRPYGSDALLGPLEVLLNKGFAVAQFQNRDRFIFDYNYGGRHVWKSITDLRGSVQRFGGWNEVLRTEVLPTSFEWKNWKWAPNYIGHVFEGGVTNQKIEEWYRVHGIPMPGVAAFLTTMTSAVINEMYSHPGVNQGSASTAMDLLLFDPLGILLFRHDRVSRFFSKRLGARIWSGQAGLTPSGELVNNGNNLILKVPLSLIPGTSFFTRAGLAFTPGFTFHGTNGLDVSFGFGAEGRIQGIDPMTGEEIPQLAFGGGVFLDRQGSLLASVLASEVEHRRLVVNIYPGVIPVLGGRFGTWFILRESGALRFGVSARGALGVGLGGGIN